MSVIDRAMQGLQQDQGSGADPLVLTVPEATAAILITAVSIDGVLGVGESERMHGILATSRLLRQSAAGEARPVERAITLLNERGAAAVLAASARALPPDLHATVFALATDLVLCDGRVEAREKAYIDELQRVLGIDDGTALTIVDVLLVKNRSSRAAAVPGSERRE